MLHCNPAAEWGYYPGLRELGLWMMIGLFLSDDGNGWQDILEDESLFGGKLHTKGWKDVGNYWKG